MRFSKVRKGVVVGGLAVAAVLVVGGATAFAHFPGGKVVKEVADEMDLTRHELLEQVDENNTISSLASDADVDVQAIVDEAVAGYQQRLDEAVTNDRVTQEQADAMIAQLQERIDETLNQTAFQPWGEVRGGRGRGREGQVQGRVGPGRGQGPNLAMGVVQEIVEAMEVSLGELIQQVGEDGTIGQVATDAGVDVQAIVDAELAELSEKLSEAVADEKITRDQADEILAKAETQIDSALTTEGGIAPKMSGRGGRGRGHQGPGGPGLRGRGAPGGPGGHGRGHGGPGGPGGFGGPRGFGPGFAPDAPDSVTPNVEATSI